MAPTATETMTRPHRLRTPLVTESSPSSARTAGLAQNGPPSPSPVSPIQSEYQRSASYTYLGAAAKEHFGRHNLTFKSSFSEEDLIAVPGQTDGPVSQPSSGWATPEEHDIGLFSNRIDARELALELQKPRISVQRFVDDEAHTSDSSSQERADMAQESTSTVSSVTSRARQRSSVSTNASRKPRRSWYSIATTPDSRSPSPTKQDSQDDEIANDEDKRRPNMSRRSSCLPIEEQDDTLEETVRPSTSRRSSIFRGKRPLSSIFSRSQDSASSEETIPVPTIPKSFSTDRLTTFTSGPQSTYRAAPPPRLGPADRLDAQEMFKSRKKDELWSVFRTLDGDYSKFSSKSVAFKANVVRSSLIPFLRDYADHRSTYILRSDDLDRRANILNKWWTGLIEMLHGRNNQSISGTDRPVVLDGIAGIMERPEWRLYPSMFCPMDKRVKSNVVPKTGKSSFVDYTDNDISQSVQNIFVQNLRAQMAFVVDKMSLKNASASLVSFCGKACAYAFMFVPGMADILVRLWDLQADMLRRVLTENGIDRFGNLSQASEQILPLFPTNLYQLKFTHLAEFNRKLRTPPPLPSGTTNIEWWGHWLERWTGRESDLFYVFVKYYHILVSSFLHVGSTKEERVCVPGMLLVHAQILSNLDATVHRRLGPVSMQEATAVTMLHAVDDVSLDPDAVATAIPLPPTNATRQMAENRLIMLTRDFLSERAAKHPAARQLFAETFNDLLQAATRGVSVYDNSACYTLLEFLEEALVILVRYEQADGHESLITPEFWHLMSRRMISTENTVIELRLYAFLYTIWNTVVCDSNRKADLCLGLLLNPQVFARSFNHWSPMVRAYYMRLLCWRVARYDGDAMQIDFEVFETLLERLQTTWSHHLWARDQAAESGSPLPSTAPCNPAPNRRLRIVRNDMQASSNAFSFDCITAPMIPPPQTRPQAKRYSTLSTLSSVSELENRPPSPDSSSEPSSPVGVRGFFSRFTGSRSRSSSASTGSKTPPTAGGIPIPQRKASIPQLVRSATDDYNSRDSSLKSGSSTPTDRTHRSHSFKFVIEYSPKIRQPGPIRLMPPRLPGPAHQFLSGLSDKVDTPSVMAVVEPRGIARKRAKYNGRALAEWQLIVGEYHNFLERRRNEGGVSELKYVETPALALDILKRVA